MRITPFTSIILSYIKVKRYCNIVKCEIHIRYALFVQNLLCLLQLFVFRSIFIGFDFDIGGDAFLVDLMFLR